MSEYIVDMYSEAAGVKCEPVVRCRDCTYFDKYENDEISVCYRFDNEQPIVEPDGFCAWGERRERESAEVWNQWSADDVTCSEES